jgi:hypothetical protein
MSHPVLLTVDGAKLNARHISDRVSPSSFRHIIPIPPLVVNDLRRFLVFCPDALDNTFWTHGGRCLKILVLRRSRDGPQTEILGAEIRNF